MTTIPTLREAAQQALEALVHMTGVLNAAGWATGHADAAVKALRAALAEQAAEQAEPVAWEYRATYIPNPHLDDGMRVCRDRRVAEVNGVPDTIKALSYAAAPPAPARQEPLTDAARDVLVERQRQVSAEGWTPEHDDEHVNSELSHAAGIYAIYGDVSAYGASNPPADWPWAAEWWKPSASQRRNLVKAGALILAEIERLDRAAPITAAPAEGEKR